MGALTRATRKEIAADVSWVPDFLALVAERGSVAVKDWCEERVWAQGEFWNFLRNDEKIKGAYQEALKLRAEVGVGESLGIADGSEDAKLRVETRFKLAEKWYPEVYRVRGEKEVSVVLVDAGLMTTALDLLRKVRTEKVIEVEPEA